MTQAQISCLHRLVLALSVTLLGAGAFAESAGLIHGRVVDGQGIPISGAVIEVDGRDPIESSADGSFSIAAASSDLELRIRHATFRSRRYVVTAGAHAGEILIRLYPAISVEESVTVMGIRASDEIPVTTHDLDREEIEALNYGQDMPALLQYTPSVTWYSDSGSGSNYSYLSLRGIQQTRINMTYDGAPLNDPADHALFFNNFQDFPTAVDSIQVQRGVGTSSVGSPSYGGSVNFASEAIAEEPGGDLRLTAGSFDTQRASIGYHSGISDKGLSISGRVSYSETDGYRDNSGSEHQTFFVNAGWQGERSSLKFVSFFGDEESQLAFLAVEPNTLQINRRTNPLTPEERDNFGQDFAQLKYTRVLGENTMLSASVYYNGADGWFRIWDDPVAQNDLLEFGIDQSFVGTMLTSVTTTERYTVTFGLHFNDFNGDHTLDIAEARAYLNTGEKQTANAFAKLEYRLGRWLLYGDLQYRWAEFSYDGDIDLGSIDWNFFDPKFGFRHQLNDRISIYASVGRAQREPGRLDLLRGEDNASVPHDLEATLPEEVIDYEAGVNWNTPHLAVQANLYAMEFSDEIALTGELSPIGLPLRTNVDSSYRRGLEIDVKWMMTPRWSLFTTANFSKNRIEEWTQFYDVFDDTGVFVGNEPRTHTDVRPLLSPETVANLGAEWTKSMVQVAVIGRYVSDAQLDNTNDDTLQLPSYTNVDLRASLDLSRGRSDAWPTLTVYVNNLLDSDDQFPSGYSYPFINRDGMGQDSFAGIAFYYPQSTRNVVVTARFGF